MTTSAELVEKVAAAIGETDDGEDTISTFFSSGILENAARAAISLTLEVAAGVAEGFPDTTEEPYTIPARPPADEDDLGTPEGHGSIIRFTKPAAIAQAIRALNP